MLFITDANCRSKQIFYAAIATEFLQSAAIKRQADADAITPTRFAIAVYVVGFARHRRHVEINEQAWQAGGRAIAKPRTSRELCNEDYVGKNFGKAMKRIGHGANWRAQQRLRRGADWRERKQIQPLGVVVIDITNYELMAELSLNYQRYRHIVADAIERLQQPIGNHSPLVVDCEGNRLNIDANALSTSNFRKVSFHLSRDVQPLTLFMWLLAIKPDVKQLSRRMGIGTEALATILGVRLKDLKQELAETVQHLNEHYFLRVNLTVKQQYELLEKYSYGIGADKARFWKGLRKAHYDGVKPVIERIRREKSPAEPQAESEPINWVQAHIQRLKRGFFPAGGHGAGSKASARQ